LRLRTGANGADRCQSGGSAQAAGTGRVGTQTQCEARQQQIRDPVSGIRINAGDGAVLQQTTGEAMMRDVDTATLSVDCDFR